MPKKVLTVNNFHGGMNDNTLARDLEDNEFVSIIDFNIGKFGKIVPHGTMTNEYTGANGSTKIFESGAPSQVNHIRPGSGLFRFESDYNNLDLYKPMVIARGGWTPAADDDGTLGFDNYSTLYPWDSSTRWNQPCNFHPHAYSDQNPAFQGTISGMGKKAISKSSSEVNPKRSYYGIASSRAYVNSAWYNIFSINIAERTLKTTKDNTVATWMNGGNPTLGNVFALYGQNSTSSAGLTNSQYWSSLDLVTYHANGRIRIGVSPNKDYQKFIHDSASIGYINPNINASLITNSNGDPTDNFNSRENSEGWSITYHDTVLGPLGFPYTATTETTIENTDGSTETSISLCATDDQNDFNNTEVTHTSFGNLSNQSHAPGSKTIEFWSATGHPDAPNGSWNYGEGRENNSFWLYASYLYDGGEGKNPQEGPLSEVSQNLHNWLSGSGYSNRIKWSRKIGSANGHDPRITGWRYYIKWSPNDEPKLFFEIQMHKGSRYANTSKWYPLKVYEHDDGTIMTAGFDGVYLEEPPTGAETFYTLNGYEPTMINFDSINGPKNHLTSWTDAVVANGRVYAGNIMNFDYISQDDLNNSTKGYYHLPDRLLFSEVGKPDIFPEDNFIDVEIDDGDDITALETYADRIFMFKNRVLHVINISKGTEFLEGSYDGKGVVHKSQVCKTDMGLAWGNNKGLYLFDGQSIQNLLEDKKGVLRISDWASDWDDMYAMVGYEPKERQLIVMKSADYSASSNPVGWVYNLRTQSIVKIKNKFKTSKFHSNFILSEYDELMNCTYPAENNTSDTLEFYAWEDSPATTSTDAEIITKDYDLGAPGVIKKFYSIKISYSINDGTNRPTVYYRLDGSTAWVTLETLANTSGALSNKEISVNKSAYSIQFKISGTTHSTFVLNDYSIIYRPKIGIR